MIKAEIMNSERIYILGCGAIGFPLAAFLARQGKDVVAVRTSTPHSEPSPVDVTVAISGDQSTTQVTSCGLGTLEAPKGIFVVTAKAAANEMLAAWLTRHGASGPVVLMQNGLGVEEPFLQQGIQQLYRTILYFTSEARAPGTFAATAFKSSMTGLVNGTPAELQRVVECLDSPELPVAATDNINSFIWQKAIVNVAFNSICPLLGVDNGIFIRDPAAVALAEKLIAECIQVARTEGVHLDPSDLRQQVLDISRKTDGLLISTLQDLNAGRATEMPFINLAVVHKAAQRGLESAVPATGFLGHLVQLKETLG